MPDGPTEPYMIYPPYPYLHVYCHVTPGPEGSTIVCWDGLNLVPLEGMYYSLYDITKAIEAWCHSTDVPGEAT